MKTSNKWHKCHAILGQQNVRYLRQVKNVFRQSISGVRVQCVTNSDSIIPAMHSFFCYEFSLHLFWMLLINIPRSWGGHQFISGIFWSWDFDVLIWLISLRITRLVWTPDQKPPTSKWSYTEKVMISASMLCVLHPCVEQMIFCLFSLRQTIKWRVGFCLTSGFNDLLKSTVEDTSGRRLSAFSYPL